MWNVIWMLIHINVVLIDRETEILPVLLVCALYAGLSPKCNGTPPKLSPRAMAFKSLSPARFAPLKTQGIVTDLRDVRVVLN